MSNNSISRLPVNDLALTAKEATAPDEPELVITIFGRAKSGKSTLAMFLGLCLEQAGIDVQEIKNEDSDPSIIATTLKERLKSLAARKPVITIDMTQLERNKVKFILPGGA